MKAKCFLSWVCMVSLLAIGCEKEDIPKAEKQAPQRHVVPMTRKVLARAKFDGGPVRLVPFDAGKRWYVVELGHRYARFYGNSKQLTDASQRPVEIVTPWDANDVNGLRFTQQAGGLRFDHPRYPTYTLKRVNDMVWTLTEKSHD